MASGARQRSRSHNQNTERPQKESPNKRSRTTRRKEHSVAARKPPRGGGRPETPHRPPNYTPSTSHPSPPPGHTPATGEPPKRRKSDHRHRPSESRAKAARRKPEPPQ
ncbi:hypothetical protein WJX77_003567 [Trebouxia sp. C0004]